MTIDLQTKYGLLLMSAKNVIRQYSHDKEKLVMAIERLEESCLEVDIELKKYTEANHEKAL